MDHAKVYLGQALDEDFKNSSLSNQYNTAEGFIERLYGSAVNESGVDFINYVKKFNKNQGRVKIIYIDGNSATMKCSVDGVELKRKEIIIPKTPHD